jgi:hypothetical protein
MTYVPTVGSLMCNGPAFPDREVIEDGCLPAEVRVPASERAQYCDLVPAQLGFHPPGPLMRCATVRDSMGLLCDFLSFREVEAYAGVLPIICCREKCRWPTTVCSSWMNCPSSDARSWRSCASRSRRVSYTYNLTGVLNLNLLETLAVRLLSLRGSGRVQ